MQMLPTISYISIGNELLKGRIVNTNAARMAEILRANGYTLVRTVVCADTGEAIEKAVTEELAAHDIVVMSGGLGPTVDDITKQTLARLFDMPLAEDAATLEHLKQLYARLGREMGARNAAQAMVPTGCEVITNWHGTAPGMLFRRGEKMLFSGPGVPVEVLKMLENGWIPKIKERWPTGTYRSAIVRLFDVPESEAADRLAPIEPTYPEGIDISYLPRIDGLWLEFSINGDYTDAEAGEKLAEVVAKVKAEFGYQVYAEGPDSIEALLGQRLRARGLTIAVAESLTGGNIAAKIVGISGASDYFKGSVTAYLPEIKRDVLGVSQDTIDTHGVVSEEVARQMAEGVRRLMGADIGLSTTGMAEVSNATVQGEMPRAWIGIATADGTKAKLRTYFYRERGVVIDRVAQAALLLALKEVEG
jgi:nicotinamide-nucleotide amidase